MGSGSASEHDEEDDTKEHSGATKERSPMSDVDVDSDDGGYELSDVLKVPRATTYTTGALLGEHQSLRPEVESDGYHVARSAIEQIANGQIILDPDYQRGWHWVQSFSPAAV